jgi:uncharacterized membrane protein
MLSLSNIGRIFYGVSIVVLGLLAIYYKAFPYMLLPPQYLTPGNEMITIVSGVLLVLAGLFIVLQKQTRLFSFLLGIVLLLIFCFCFIPFMFSAKANYRHLTEWENAEKELALAGGALIIAGYFSPKNKKNFGEVWAELIPIGAILYSIPIISFGILHFLYAKEISTMVPTWVPYHLFWTYLAGVALLGSGIAIILKIKTGLIAALLGTIIFIWFAILHVPRVIVSSLADLGDEITSFCYCRS